MSRFKQGVNTTVLKKLGVKKLCKPCDLPNRDGFLFTGVSTSGTLFDGEVMFVYVEGSYRAVTSEGKRSCYAILAGWLPRETIK